MPTTEVNTTDQNATIDLNVIDDLSMNLEKTVQTMLVPMYEKYPILANTFWDIPLANLFAAVSVFLLFLLFRKLFTLIVMGTLQKIAKYTNTYHDDKIISALKDPVRFAFILIGAHLFFLLIFKETELIKNILNTSGGLHYILGNYFCSGVFTWRVPSCYRKIQSGSCQRDG